MNFLEPSQWDGTDFKNFCPTVGWAYLQKFSTKVAFARELAEVGRQGSSGLIARDGLLNGAALLLLVTGGALIALIAINP